MSTSEHPLLIESIRLEDGRLPLLDLHQSRLERAQKRFFPKEKSLRLGSLLRDSDLPEAGMFKVRIVYGKRLHKLEVQPYQLRRIDTLQLVDATGLNYTHKFADREAIQNLWKQRNGADDVLMAQCGYIMDTSYANVALHDGYHWYTPAWPLLRGVRRCHLIRQNQLRPKLIRVKDLRQFKEIRMFNAMVGWEESRPLAISQIRW